MAKSRSTPPSAVQKRLAAERASAARERIQVAQRQRRLTVIASAVGVIVLVVAVFVIVKVTVGGAKSGKKTTAAATSVTQALSSVPTSVFDKIGAGTATGAPEIPTKPAGLAGGKTPEVLYVGAEFCPYCAAERWPLTVALARFGTFTNLGQTSSSPSDVNPNTPTLSYHGASYTSRYLDFVGKEVESNQLNSAGNAYTTLDKLTSSQQKLFSNNGSSFPFLDIAGKYTLASSQYDGKILAGMTQDQVADAIGTPSTDVSRAVVGSANVLTARLCQVTGQQPAKVCASRGVQTAAKAISTASSGK